MAFQNPTFSSLLAAFLCLTVFYFLFRWRFGKETFWQANRVYLLFVPFLAWVIPHLQVQLTPASPLSEAIDPALLIQLLQLRQEAEGWFTAEQAPERSIPLGDLLLWVYAGGVLWNISLAIVKTSRILYLAHLGERQDFGSFTLVSNARISGPASFFRFVFSPPQQPVSGMVLEHELAHVRQGHSFDILLMELWVALHWYNPLIYRMRRHLRATHEYIADAAVVSRSEGAYAYARLLISQPQNRVPMLYNTFAAQISSRLRMLARRPSARWKLVAHAITLPLAAGLGLFFSVQVIEATPMPEAFKPIASALDRLEHARIDASTLPFSAPAEEKEASVESMEPEKTARIADLRMLPSAAFPEICSQLVGTDTLPPASTIRIEISSDSARTKSSSLKNVLVVVDGEIKTGTDGDEIIKTMDPGDIQSIEVLKGESAIAIYGEKGREGVIMITTKKGKQTNQLRTTVNKSNEDKSMTITVVTDGEGTIKSTGRKATIQVEDEGNKTTTVQFDGNININSNSDDPFSKISLLRITHNGNLIGEIKNPALTKTDGSFQGVDEIKLFYGEKSVQEYDPKSKEKGIMIFEFKNKSEAEEALKKFRELKKN